MNKIAILSKKDFIFTFQASLICFRSRGKIRFFFLRLQDCYGCVQGYRPRRERGRRQLLRSRQQTREDPDAVQHAPLHRKVSTFLDVWPACTCQRTLDVSGFSYRSGKRYFLFYERTQRTLHFDKLFADFYARRGLRYKKVVPSRATLVLDVWISIHFSSTVIVEKKNRSDIFSFERSMATIWNADDSIFYGYFLNIYDGIDVAFIIVLLILEFFMYTLLNL